MTPGTRKSKEESKKATRVPAKSDHRHIGVSKIREIREAFSRKKIAKITFEEFENMTGEVLGE